MKLIFLLIFKFEHKSKLFQLIHVEKMIKIEL